MAIFNRILRAGERSFSKFFRFTSVIGRVFGAALCFGSRRQLHARLLFGVPSLVRRLLGIALSGHPRLVLLRRLARSIGPRLCSAPAALNIEK